MSKNSTLENNMVPTTAENVEDAAVEACKTAHKSLVNSTGFDMYALSKQVQYVDRNAPSEMIPLAAKRAAFRLKYPMGSIEFSDPVQREGYNVVRATVYIPSPIVSDENGKANMLAISTGLGYFVEPGTDCANIYRAQDRALRNALHNAGFQGVTEGSDIAGEGIPNLDLFYDGSSSPHGNGYPAPRNNEPLIVANDDPAAGSAGKSSGKRGKSSAKAEKDEKSAETATVEEQCAVQTTILPDDVAAALDANIYYQGIRGTVGELLRSKRVFVKHLSDQYTINRLNLKEEELPMFSACNLVITAIDKDPALCKMLTE